MKILITGASGFLGRYITAMLAQRGHTLHSLSRSSNPNLESFRVVQFQGDLANLDSVMRAAEGCLAVFHVAALTGHWGRYADFYRSNVLGTQNIIKACQKLGIARLIYTSSPSVVFAGRNQTGVNESVPYPERFYSPYPATKAEAEKMVLRASDATLHTVSLRPHLIWGPGDNHLAPTFVNFARQGRLISVGNGLNLMDAVYVENAAEAHLIALDLLSTDPARIAGKSFFITNQEPWPLDRLLSAILQAYDLKAPIWHLPYALAYPLGGGAELLYRCLRLKGEPRLTRFLVMELAHAHYFDPQRARDELGYRPRVSMDEGFKRIRRDRDCWIAREFSGSTR